MKYYDNGVRPESGDTTIDNDIIFSVVGLATREIAGVASLASKLSNVAAKLTGSFKDGVRITNIDGKLNIDIYINVYFDSNISEVAYRVQENVKNSLSTMIDVEVSRINVHVEGVEFEKDGQED